MASFGKWRSRSAFKTPVLLVLCHVWSIYFPANCASAREGEPVVSSTSASSSSPEQALAALRAALVNPNVSSFALTSNIKLTADLPFRENGSFRVEGRCVKKSCVIDGDDKYSGFYGHGQWSFSKLTFQNLALEANNSDDAGGSAIRIGRAEKFGHANVSYCRFKNNMAAFRGGAVGVWGGTLYVHECTFSSNRAHYGGAVSLNTFAVGYFTSTDFTRNKASVAGGAIYSFESSVNNTWDCRFNQNSAGESGGAIALEKSYSYIATIASCVFKGNYAGVKGGAVNVADFNVDRTFCSVDWKNNKVGDGKRSDVHIGESDLVLNPAVYFCPSRESATITLANNQAYGSYVLDDCKLC